MNSNLTKYGIVFVVAIFLGTGLGCGLGTKPTPNNQSATPTPTETPNPLVPTSNEVFQGRVGEFTKLPAKVQIINQPYIKGKMAYYTKILSIKDKEAQWKYSRDLGFNGYKIAEPFDTLYADKPEDIQTVILNTCRESKEGLYRVQYSNDDEKSLHSLPGLIWKCELTIIDMSIPAVIHRKDFKSDVNTLTFVSPNDKEVKFLPPSSEIEAFIGNLPRK
jgi:hypothetical protein